MSKPESFDSLLAAIDEADSFVVMSHVRPDGDAYGSTLACALWLEAQGKQVRALNSDGLLEKFRYLPGSERIQLPNGQVVRGAVGICLDTSTRERLGDAVGAVPAGAPLLNIDHHISNERYGSLNYIDGTSPATGQILFRLIKASGQPITRAIAENLFAAISTDTGSFQYSSTTPETFRIAAELAESGIEIGSFSREMYERLPRRRLNLLRDLLKGARFSNDGRVAGFSMSVAQAQAVSALPEDTEGLIDYLRSVDEVIVAAFFEELEGEGRVRVSLRSKDDRVDVCAICMQFGGGGHRLAAGARVRGALGEVEERVWKAITDEIRKID